MNFYVQQKNPSCFVETYQGGLSCCHHKNVLLDADQIQPTHEMTYSLKFRFWFQEYTNQSLLERFYYQTEANSGEYDVPKCEEGISSNNCVHSITAHWNAKKLINQNKVGSSKGFELIYAAPHCHAPSCLSVELYNADTSLADKGSFQIATSSNLPLKFQLSVLIDDPLNSSFQIHDGHCSSSGVSIIEGRGSLFEQE